MILTSIKKVMELLVQVSFIERKVIGDLFLNITFQNVIVMPLVQVVCNVLIQLVNVPAMLATKEQNVMLLVDVMALVRVVQRVISLRVNVLAALVIKVPHVMLLAVVMPLVRAARHVMLQQVNVLAIVFIQVPHVTL